MSLQLVVGPADSGKSFALQEQLRAASAARRRSLLLLPSAPDVSRALLELAPLAPLGVSVQTLDSFLDELWLESDDPLPIVTPVQRLALMEESVRTHSAGDLVHSARSQGLIRALVLLAERGRNPERCVVRGSGPAMALVRCLEAYEELLRRAGLVERADAHRVAVERWSGTQEHPDLVVLDRFTGLTPAQERFVVAAAETGEVFLALPYAPSVPATLSASALVERLLTAGGTLVPTEATSPAPTRNAEELARIHQSLGSYDPDGAIVGGSVVLSEAWGGQAEAGRIAREVQDAVSSGIPAGQIAVVFRSAGRRVGDLERAFADAGIALEFDALVPFSSAGLGRALLAVLEPASDEHSSLLDVLRSRYSPLPNDVLDRLDATARRSQTGGFSFIRSWCARNEPSAISFLRDLQAASRDVAGPKAEGRWYRLVNTMLALAHPPGETLASGAVLDAAAARSFMDALRSLVGLVGTDVSPRVLAAALRQTTVALSSEDRPDYVQVMSAERVRGRRYRCVIVGGLNAGEFPRDEPGDALSSPSIAPVLARCGYDPAPRISLDDERLLFYQVVTRASERLVLSWQSHDAEGLVRRPSILLEEFLDLYRDPTTGVFPQGSPRHRVLALDWRRSPHAPHRLRRPTSEEGGSSTKQGRGDLRRHELRARSQAAQEAVQGRSVFSASEIETYLQCPYRWCLDRLVRPDSLDEQMDVQTEGQIGHEILRRFYEELLGTGAERVTPGSLSLVRELHERVSEEVLRCVEARSLAEEAALKAVKRATLGLLESDATLMPGLRPVHHEFSFGLDDEPEEFDGFALRGRIDRIDADDRCLFITDYKRGDVSGRCLQKFEAAGLVQLPLYAAVASRRLGLEIAGGAYRSFDSRKKPRGFIRQELADQRFVRTDTVDAAQIETVVQTAISRSAAAVAGMREGDITPAPLGGTCPAYCRGRAFCPEWRPGASV